MNEAKNANTKRNIANTTFAKISHFSKFFYLVLYLVFLDNVHENFAFFFLNSPFFHKVFAIFFFEKFLHFLFCKIFSLFRKTDLIEILRFSRANKMWRNGKCDFPSSLEPLILKVELIHTSSTTSQIREQSFSWLWQTHLSPLLSTF